MDKVLTKLLTVVVLVLTLSIIVYGLDISQWMYYREITIVEQSGSTLTDFPVMIILNDTNFNAWDKINPDCSDIRFTDTSYRDLQYYILYCNVSAHLIIAFVQIPEIPASNSIKILMFYGNRTTVTDQSNMSIFEFYDDFTETSIDTSKWSVVSGSWSIQNGYLISTTDNSKISTASTFTRPLLVIIGRDVVAGRLCWLSWLTDSAFDINPGSSWRGNGYYSSLAPPGYEVSIQKLVDGSGQILVESTEIVSSSYEIRIVETRSSEIIIRDITNGTIIVSASDTDFTSGYINLEAENGVTIDAGCYIDFVIIQPWVDPPPEVVIGPEISRLTIKLPIKSITFTHNITYSPKASDFAHSFSASNETTAGYEVSNWSWKVYANPYQSGGSSYENTAYLVSEINITLPYGKAFVKNITLQAKTNGTGTFRQLWVKVLNSSGEVITEITNASIDTSWTEIVIPIEQEVTDLVTIWINATVKSSTTTGEEIDIANVKVFTENVFNPVVTCPLRSNKKYFNCSFTHTFDLGNSSLVNETFSKIYIINYLIYNTSNYPVKPSYVGNVTINNDVYNVYVINPSNYTGSYVFYVLLENRYRSGVWKVHTHGVTLSEMIIGDVVCIDLPETGNITIRLGEWNYTWLNTSHVCWRINNTGTLNIEFVRNLTNVYDVGYGSYVITVTYGNLTINTLDINNTLINYEELKMVMYNRDWGLKYEGKGFGKFIRNDLWTGNYTVTIYYLDVPICNFTYWLNSTNTGSIIDATCNMFKQGKDYRGINKTVAWMWNVTLLNVTNLNKKYPWSITKFVLNGSSGAKFCIAWDYESDLPTAVNVESNASELTWKWVNTTLIICGKFGSTVYVTVTDLYKLSIKYFDRLGRLLKYLGKLPETIINNEIVLKGYDVWIYLPPEDYVVKVPKEIVKNFVFPFHNVNGSTVNTISFSIVRNDVFIKPVYKVPVEFTELKIVYVTPSEVYVQGRLVDYLGYPVVNKSIYVELWSLVKNYRLDGDLVKTDEAGYFITKPFTIPVNESVMFRIWFEGDDIYNGNETSIEIMQVSTYTLKPSIWQKPEIIIIALIILAVIIILIAVLKRGKVVVLSSRKKMFKIT